MNDKTEPLGCLGSFLRIFGIRGGASATNTSESAGAAAESEELPYRLREDFLSAAELSFYRVLEQAVADRYAITAKVRLWDLLYVPRQEGSRYYENKISSKHVDFVLCDRSMMRPALVIELDDASHNRKDRQDRDELVDRALAAAGLPILHVRAARTYSVAELSANMAQVLQLSPASPAAPASTQPPPAPTDPVCPTCQAAMVERKASKGKHAGKRFWACSNYPQCRHIIGIA
ncbi:DUF2726 domain-containing protein [Candidatus Laterigemmans baculatus]|uniref:DUF2726 domain-containing protein n=1 Tax=Candidatus Laterigemmans baculatus TaxID=2770505 RepID=UPI0013DA4AA4|nr:DUF2726 domain-containing protein [Candidatus Laterigemmans baculatus]